MGLRATLVLLLLVGALGLGMYLTSDRPAQDTDVTEEALDGRHVFAASRISVRSQLDVQPIVLEQDGRLYRLVEPLRDLASGTKLEEVAKAWDTAHLLRWRSADAVTPDLLRQTGLDKPRGEVTFEYGDGTVRIELGSDGPLGEEMFLRKNGAIYEGGKALYSSIQGTPADYREHYVFRIEPARVQQVRVVQHGDGGRDRELVLERVGAKDFRLRQPIDARARRDVVHGFLGAVLGLHADTFLDGNANPQPRPDVEVQITGDGRVQTVQLWKQGGSALLGHAEPRNLDFTVEVVDYGRIFEVSVDQLRSRLLNPYPPTEVYEVTLDPGGGEPPVVLQRGAGDLLELRKPFRAKTDPSAVSALISGLNTLVASDFVGDPGDLDPYGLGDAAFRLRIVGPLRGRAVEILLGRDDGDSTYCKRADERHVVKVPKASADNLRQAWPRFVSRQVQTVDVPATIQRLRYRQGDREVLFERGDDGEWRRPDGGAMPKLFDEIVDELADLDAKDVLDPAHTGALGDPIEVTLMMRNGMELKKIELLRRGGDVLVRRPGVKALYLLRSSTRLLEPWS